MLDQVLDRVDWRTVTADLDEVGMARHRFGEGQYR